MSQGLVNTLWVKMFSNAKERLPVAADLQSVCSCENCSLSVIKEVINRDLLVRSVSEIADHLD